MFEKWFVDYKNIKNVKENGKAIGFSVGIKPPYYRGVNLSIIKKIGITLDGHEFPTENLKFSVEAGTFTWKQMEDEVNARWEFGETAQVFVPLNGGISKGYHTIEVEVCILVVYWGGAAYAKYPFSFEMTN